VVGAVVPTSVHRSHFNPGTAGLPLHGPQPESLTSTSSPDSPDTAAPASVDTSGQTSSTGYQLGDINLFHGVPFFLHPGQQWAGFQTGAVDVVFSHDDVQCPLWQNQQAGWPSLSRLEALEHGITTELPGRDSLEPYLDLYQSSPVSNAFPIADPVLFPATIEKAYQSDPSSWHDVLPAKACIFSFLAFVSMVCNPDEKTLPLIDMARCETAAHLLILDISNTRVSTEVVDAIMMFVSRAFS